MTKTLKNNNRNLVILIIIWALVLALTLIGVYMYYENKIEQLEHSIDKQPEPVSYRISALSVRRVLKIPSGEGTGEGKTANPDLPKQGCVHGSSSEFVIQPHLRSVNTPLILSLDAPESVPSPEGIPFEHFLNNKNNEVIAPKRRGHPMTPASSIQHPETSNQQPASSILNP